MVGVCRYRKMQKSISRGQQDFDVLLGTFLFSQALAVTKKYGDVVSGDVDRARVPRFFPPRKDKLDSKEAAMVSSTASLPP
jgi:hypothetical protein